MKLEDMGITLHMVFGCDYTFLQLIKAFAILAQTVIALCESVNQLTEDTKHQSTSQIGTVTVDCIDNIFAVPQIHKSTTISSKVSKSLSLVTTQNAPSPNTASNCNNEIFL
jgi:hypothetical protein